MAINEVFTNPTVKQVILEVRFPNLFFLESRIGQFQIDIMREFPDSKLLLTQEFRLTTNAQRDSPQREPTPPEATQSPQKIWSFTSLAGVTLNLTSNSLSITSDTYKSYNNAAAPHRFRDSIQFAIDRFLKLLPIPSFTRIGLRYIDLCPVPPDLATFDDWYQTTFPLSRFPLADAKELHTMARVQRAPNRLGSVSKQDSQVLADDRQL